MKWGWAGFLRGNNVPAVLANVALVTVLSLVLMPLLAKLEFFAADRNRLILIVPVLIAIPLAFLAEYSREAARYAVAVRRVMANGCGAAMLIWFVRVFFQTGGYRMDPEPSGSSQKNR